MDIRWNENWLENGQPQTLPIRDSHDTGECHSLPLSRLIFDFSGVLYDNSTWRRWLIQQLHRIGVHTHYDLFYRLWERDYLPKLEEGEKYWRSLERYLLAVGLAPAQALELALAGKSRCEQTMRQLRPFPGVAKTLHLLAVQEVRMDVICSCHWSRHEVASRLQRMGLTRFFQSITCLSETEHRDISQLVEGVSQDDDSVEQTALIARTPRPLQAARRFGLVPIAFNHTNDCVAAFHLDRIDDLVPIANGGGQTRRLAS